MKINTSGPTTPPRRRRGDAGGPYGAVKGALPSAPACLTGEQEDAQTNKNQWPHRSPLDPTKDAGIGGEQQHPERDEQNAGRPRMAAVMAVPFNISLRAPPVLLGRRRAGTLLTRWRRAPHIVCHAPRLIGQALRLRVKLI